MKINGLPVVPRATHTLLPQWEALSFSKRQASEGESEVSRNGEKFTLFEISGRWSSELTNGIIMKTGGARKRAEARCMCSGIFINVADGARMSNLHKMPKAKV